jgi:hypothetical protein
MKFCYVDETGSGDEGDVFVMAGLLIDAYRLRKHTAHFDQIIQRFLEKHPRGRDELKTKAILNGSDGWNKVDPDDRKNFVRELINLATGCARVFAVAFSFKGFAGAADAGHGQTFGNSYWLGAAMFVSALVQKRMQGEPKNKGLTVLICDDNKREMASLSDALHNADPWFDPIYQTKRKKKKNGTSWIEVKNDERFDQIVNTAFAIKSQHSSFTQVADAVAYVYRRHLELQGDQEAWDGEGAYYTELYSALEATRARLGQTPDGSCIKFYEAARHANWRL